MPYLLDTNIVSDIIRHPQGLIAEKIRAVGEDQICTSIIVAAELRYSVAKKRSAKLATQLESVLGALHIVPFDAPADRAYGLIRHQLDEIGKPIGGNDLLVAAQAVALDYILVSDDRGFARIKGIAVENWLR
jgi:tRNA(fMet)-specific endonuclease VapC